MDHVKERRRCGRRWICPPIDHQLAVDLSLGPGTRRSVVAGYLIERRKVSAAEKRVRAIADPTAKGWFTSTSC
jgi:hypothetical protein